MNAAWIRGWAIPYFRASFWGNIAGLVISIVLTALMPDDAKYSITILSFSIGIVIPSVTNVFLNLIDIGEDIRIKGLYILISAGIIGLIGILVKKDPYLIVTSLVVLLFCMYFWGSIDSCDKKYGEKLERLERYTNPNAIKDDLSSKKEGNIDV